MARRGANEGTVFRRKDGRWVAIVSVGYEGGRRDRKSFYGRTRAEVVAKKTTALRSLQQGEPMANDSVTVGAFLARWLDESVRPTLRPRTFDSYRSITWIHLIPALGQTRLAKLVP